MNMLYLRHRLSVLRTDLTSILLHWILHPLCEALLWRCLHTTEEEEEEEEDDDDDDDDGGGGGGGGGMVL